MVAATAATAVTAVTAATADLNLTSMFGELFSGNQLQHFTKLATLLNTFY